MPDETGNQTYRLLIIVFHLQYTVPCDDVYVVMSRSTESIIHATVYISLDCTI